MKELSEVFKILTETLKVHDIPLGYYSFEEFSEESICIEQEHDKWIVYLGERGKKHDITEYTDVIEACMDMIERLAESDDQEREMKHNFLLNYREKTSTEKSISKKTVSYSTLPRRTKNVYYANKELIKRHKEFEKGFRARRRLALSAARQRRMKNLFQKGNGFKANKEERA